jgi:hypothetical protein
MPPVKGGGDTPAAREEKAPPPAKPTVIPNEEIKVPRREIISVEEARSIIFARGELKSEGSIDAVPD